MTLYMVTNGDNPPLITGSYAKCWKFLFARHGEKTVEWLRENGVSIKPEKVAND